MALIHAVHLISWANLSSSRDKLGELLRKLIHANTVLSNIQTIRFLANESVQLSGWDGILECQSDVPWIPSGTSVWEFSSGSSERQKIKDDFGKRREKDLPSNWDRQKTTYVAVTLRKLDNISELENELKEDSPWLDIRIFDAQSLEEWIEISPTVEAWLQEQEVGPPPSVHTLPWVWREWSNKTHPSVSNELVLAGRSQNAVDLRKNLASPGAPINIQADSPEEAVAFVYSVISSSEDALFRENFLSQSIVIGQNQDASRFQSSSAPKNIILRPPATSESLSLARYGHTVINALGNESLSQRVDIHLTRSLRSEFADALAAMGISKEQADIEARACGSSPSIWRIWNLLKLGDPGENIPNWAKEPHSALVVPAVLLGGWSERAEGDKEIIKTITGKEYAEYRDSLHPFIHMDNPLLIRVGDAWVISAPATAFALILRYITTGHLEAVSRVAKIVFEEIDPTTNLPPEERPYAGIKGMQLRHSTWLRDGLAGSLLRIAVIGQSLENSGSIPNNQSCQSYVDSIVSQLKGLKDDWRLLATLRDQLPVLVEAAPSPFMEALEQFLQGQPEKLRPIFVEGDVLFGHSFHTGLLWALETLAWNPAYLGRVSIILAKLAEIDPGGKLMNRPINSLKEIFLAWHPGTSANLKQRLQALDLLLAKNDEIGWDLLKALLPRTHGSSSPTHEPTWRDFGRSQKEVLTNKIVWDAYKRYVERAIQQAGERPERWKTLIDIYPNVTETDKKAIEERLIELGRSGISRSDRQIIWEALRQFINRQRAFPRASWLIPEEQLKRLDDIYRHFEPSDQIDQVAWLFNEQFPNIPVSQADFNVRNEELRKLRHKAIAEVWNHEGSKTLMDLINCVSYSWLLAPPLIEFLNDESKLIEVMEQTIRGTEKEKLFARSLSGRAYLSFGDSWTQLLFSKAEDLKWSSDEYVTALLDYPDSRETYNLINSLGAKIENEYWQKKPAVFGCKDKECFIYAIQKLKENGRGIEATTIMASDMAINKWNIDPIFALNLLDQALAELNEGKKPHTLLDAGYWIEQLFHWLRGQAGVDKSELARREYAFLPLLTQGFEKEDLALHDILASDAAFFVDVLCDLYKPASKLAEDYEPSKEARVRAEFAWQLLKSWRRPPGVEDNGEVNGEKLKKWIENARQLALQKDRGDIADQEIGRVLFYYPDDPGDSLWPHVELRKLLEDVQSSHIETGIEIAQHNSRGVIRKAVFEGGAQERVLAQKWGEAAEKIGVRWVRTKALLERIASYWKADAKREDERAEKDRLRFR